MRTSEHVPTLFNRTGPIYTLASVLLLVTSLLFFSYDASRSGFEHSAKHVQETIKKTEESQSKDLDALVNLTEQQLFARFNSQQKDYDARGLSYFVFEDGSLLAWSTNSVPGAERLPELIASGPCVLLSNGWYLIDKLEEEGRTVFGLFLIKYEYLYENKYLVNQFHSCFNLQNNPRIQFTPEGRALPILNADTEVIFYLSEEHNPNVSSYKGVIILFFLGISVFLVLRYVFNLLYSRNQSLWVFISAALIILLTRYLTLQWGWPSGLRSIDLFDVAAFRDSVWHPSLADLVVNAFLLLLLSYIYKEWIRNSNEGKGLIHISLLTVGFFYLCRRLDSLIKGLIQDSNVRFDISNFFDLDVFSIYGVIGVALLLLALLFLAQTLISLAQLYKRSKRFNYLIIFSSLVVIVLVNQYMGVVDMVKVLWPWILLLYLLLAEPIRHSGPKLVYILGIMAVLSFYSAFTFEKQVVKRDRDKLEVIADRLMEGADSVAEYLFDDIRDELSSDTILWDIASRTPLDGERLLTQLRQDYFNGYWTKYNLDIKTSSGPNAPQHEIGKSTEGIGFFRAPDTELGLNYIMSARPDSSARIIYVEFQLNIVPEELGFPELLIEGGSLELGQLNDYSFAQYAEGELINFYGDYDYKLKQPDLYISESGYFQEEGYWHFPFIRATDTYLISTPRKSFMSRLTTFTYLFCFLGVMIALAFIVEGALISRQWPRADLQNKIQFLVVSILFSSLLVFGVGAYYYIISQNRMNNESLLSEKVSSVLIELSHKLEKEKALGDKEKLELYLDKFAKVFFTDINLYSLKGQLMASSRPQVFSRGLISEQMDSRAYQQLALGHESRYIHEERIGGLNYLSAYVPFMDSKKEVLAYLNLPYFARQGELEDELSRFLVAVVNILVLLFVLSILVAVLVSNWITRPLQLLKENLAAIRLDKRNQPIEYSGSDEIASLVAEYNSKVDELQTNAELLAKSERESAWREMAKQVAHEIKNPLTPMKLSIQYLQKTRADEGLDWEERFQRSTTMLIEQIDTLSGIASAFSDFAQMPKASNEHFDLIGLIHQVADLFAEDPVAEISVNIGIDEEAEVFADKDQMSRVLTNLIKNAFQSIPDEQEGKVDIELISKGYQYILEVRDNGTGVPEEMKERIFVPNFTTKTTGTGLGLAMSKNIVELAGGSIWFTTQEGSGSSFFVSLPQSVSDKFGSIQT